MRGSETAFADAVQRLYRTLIWVALFSAVLTGLMLTGPIFMLQVYDRVLASHSEATLIVLFGLVVYLYGVMAFIDHFRGRALARAGAHLQDSCEERVFSDVLEAARQPAVRSRPDPLMRDFTTVQGFLASQMPTSLLDLPWTPVFCVLLFVIHPVLGLFSIGAAVILLALTFGAQIATRGRQGAAQAARSDADALAEAMRRHAETLHGLGMVPGLLSAWKAQQRNALRAAMTASDRSGALTSATKSLRLLLQSGMLALGAFLALRGAISPGMMIAGTILMGRALAPIEQTIAQWPAIQQAFGAWSRVKLALTRSRPSAQATTLPSPSGRVTVKNLTLVAPGDAQVLLAGIDFEIGPGDVLGVIGPSGSGKSALARALAGIWPAVRGEIRLDGARLDQYPAAELGQYLGYVPQDVDLLPGTIARNIARFDPEATSPRIVDAARIAGAHEMILSLPKGYDTVIGEGGSAVSGGQRQRIALARAFYCDPPVLILDEPNSSLDEVGLRQLDAAILRAKVLQMTVIIMSHRPSALTECTHILLLEGGLMRAFGPRDEVLAAHVRGGATVLDRHRGRERKTS